MVPFGVLLTKVYISLLTHQQFKTRDADFVLLLLLFFFFFFPSVLIKYMLLFLSHRCPLLYALHYRRAMGSNTHAHKPLYTYRYHKHTCTVFLQQNQHLDIHILSFNLCFRVPDRLARVVEGRKSLGTMALRILRCILFLYDLGEHLTPPYLARIRIYTETRTSSRLEAATALLLLLVQGNRNGRTELATSQAENFQAEPATLKVIPAYMVVGRRPSNTEIISYCHGPSAPERRQIARHNSLVSEGKIAGASRKPRTRFPRRHTSISLVAP